MTPLAPAISLLALLASILMAHAASPSRDSRRPATASRPAPATAARAEELPTHPIELCIMVLNLTRDNRGQYMRHSYEKRAAAIDKLGDHQEALGGLYARLGGIYANFDEGRLCKHIAPRLKDEGWAQAVIESKQYRDARASYDKLSPAGMQYLASRKPDKAPYKSAAMVHAGGLTWQQWVTHAGQAPDKAAVIACLEALLIRNAPDEIVRAIVAEAIRRGDPSAIRTICDILKDSGDRQLAELVLNCGEETLQLHGKIWGREHGLSVMPRSSAQGPPVTWGAR